MEQLHPDMEAFLVSFKTSQILKIFQWFISVPMIMKAIFPTFKNYENS